MTTHSNTDYSQVFGENLSNLWDPNGLPYSAELLNRIQAPWELLQSDVFQEVFAQARQRKGQNSLPNDQRLGLITQDTILYQGEWLQEPDEVISGLDRCTKKGLKIEIHGSELKGASYIQAGTTIVASQDSSQSISLGQGCFIQSGSYLAGPISLGDYCEVRQGAYLRGKIVAGNHCVLGHTSEFKNVILHDGAKAAHFAYVGDSILGASANLGAGTKVSNLKITPGPIHIALGGLGKVNTEMIKLGGILGDRVETGCNAVLNPGSLLGADCKVYPTLAVASGWYRKRSWLTPKTKGSKE